MRQWYPGPIRLTYTFNWDNKLRKAEWPGNNSIELKNDPLGNRVYKKSTASGSSTEHKYVVDISGELPTILLEINPTTGSLTKTYIYANSEILAQHACPWGDGDTSADRYFYLHDRLGSVRLVIDDQGAVQNYYTYEPFGEMFATECTETTENPFKFTGQYFDSEIEEYYVRARQYNPRIARFTSRDPVSGTIKKPLTLHKYLYCLNDPINKVDPSGRLLGSLVSADTQVKMAGAAFAAQIVTTHLVNTINMRANLMAVQLDNFSLEAMVVLSDKLNKLAEVAEVAGTRGLCAVSQFVSQCTTFKTYEEQMQFIANALGASPGVPSTYAESVGFLVHEAGTMIWETLNEED